MACDDIAPRREVARTEKSQLRRIQKKRDSTFSSQLATGIVSRGIDADVAHVINYDMPNEMDPYTHRVGRTGRAGKREVLRSTAFLSLLTLEDKDVFYALKQELVKSNSLEPPKLARHAKFKPRTVLDRFSKRPRHRDSDNVTSHHKAKEHNNNGKFFHQKKS
ncbi:unnamed protein product [Thlaspi arvense]|uniref:Helicase C-terminal domain-containing protein n=1 Tax=Thlaspi arvense TaxID=13288 RepID=A0AAU9R5X1_THLAR|nr:unnamed protein product [Thlaspi arvense]